LRLQSDERLISLTRRGNASAFEMLVSRYQSRLLAFCRHLLGSREDAEDVLQEVLAAAFNAILADDRPINVRPWLYRIARNRSLNHLRRIQAIGVDSMDIHLSENGASTADKVHDREQFQLLVGDIHHLPETQRTALVLREMDALSYDQIAEAMDTTVPGVKSLLVRARISLADAAEARLLSCEDVRIELAEVAEGLRKRPTPLVRRHVRSCQRCGRFQGQLKHTNKALAALLPIGPLALLRQLLIVHLGHSAGTGSGATAAGATGASGAGATMSATGAAAGQAAAVAGTTGGTAMLGSTGGLISAGAGAIATKAAAGLAAAAIVTAGAVEASHGTQHLARSPVAAVQAAGAGSSRAASSEPMTRGQLSALQRSAALKHHHKRKSAAKAGAVAKPGAAATASSSAATTKSSDPAKKKAKSGRTQTQTDPTVLASPSTAPSTSTTGATPSPDPGTSTSTSTTGTTTTTAPTSSDPTSTTSTAPSGDGSTAGSTTDGSTIGATTDGSTTTTTDPTTTTSGTTTGTTTDPTDTTGTTDGTSSGSDTGPVS
jgi:RNA polymerase sigma factor (sigma-70 family)